jgi:hypothetical protein
MSTFYRLFDGTDSPLAGSTSSSTSLFPLKIRRGSVVVCNNALDGHEDVCSARRTTPPFVTIGPQFHLQVAASCGDIIVTRVHELAVNIEVNASDRIAVKAVFMRGLGIVARLVQGT